MGRSTWIRSEPKFETYSASGREEERSERFDGRFSSRSTVGLKAGRAFDRTATDARIRAAADISFAAI
jgi:hypothetical protein